MAIINMQAITLARIKHSLKVRTKNKLARFGWVRALSSLGYQSREDIRSEIFHDVKLTEIMHSLTQDGIWQGFKLPQAIHSELLDFAMNMPAYGNRDQKLGFNIRDFEAAQQKAGFKFTLASYFNSFDQCAALRQLAQDPVLNEVALRYIGPRAKHLGTNMWWSYADESLDLKERSKFAQLFHYDLDDYKFIKIFFYLTDVDEDSGPHVFVRGSHREKPLRHLYPMRRLDDADVERTYDRKDILTVIGQAGEGFVEDTFGIHKGAAPNSKSRLLVQLYYATSLGYTDDRCDPRLLGMIEI